MKDVLHTIETTSIHISSTNFEAYHVAILEGPQIAVMASIEVTNLSNVAVSMLCCTSAIYINRASLHASQFRQTTNKFKLTWYCRQKARTQKGCLTWNPCKFKKIFDLTSLVRIVINDECTASQEQTAFKSLIMHKQKRHIKWSMLKIRVTTNCNTQVFFKFIRHGLLHYILALNSIWKKDMTRVNQLRFLVSQC